MNVVSKDKSSGIVPSTLGVNNEFLSQLLQKLYDKEMEYESTTKTVGANNLILSLLKSQIEKTRTSIIEIIKNQRESIETRIKNLELKKTI